MYIPFPYQTECLEAVQNAREEGMQRALIVMASGLGKTVTMALDVKKWHAWRGQGRVLFLCHNNNILAQAKATFQAVHGLARSYGYFHGNEKRLHRVDFLFASLQTMERYKEVFGPNEFPYVMVDEGHHSQAKTYKSTIEYFKPEFLLGATATPDRLDHGDIRDIFGSETYYLPLEEAIGRGLLTPVDYRLITDEIQLSGLLAGAQARHISTVELNRRIFIPKRDEEIAKLIIEHAAEFEDPRTMIFCPTIRYCEHLASFIPDSFPIHSRMPERERAEKLEMFQEGMVNAVLTVNAFNEGIDVPQANLIVFLRSTVSRTIFHQQLGRGLRKSEGKNKVTVLDFVGNCERIRMIHNLWQSIKDATVKRRTGYAQVGAIEPMTLNVDSVEFTEKVYPLFKLMETAILPSRESLVAHLQSEKKRLGRTPTMRDAREASREKRGPSTQTIIRVFGSFNNALEAAGLQVGQRRSKDLSKPTLIAQLQAEAKRLGRTPTLRDIKIASREQRTVSHGVFDRMFGSFGEALRAAGFKTRNVPRGQLTKRSLIAGLRKEAKRLGRTPRRGSMPDGHAYRRVFGSWDNALEAAGLTPNHTPRYTKEELLSQLKRESAKLGRAPTTREIKEMARKRQMASEPTFIRNFGSLKTALEEAGVAKRKAPGRLPNPKDKLISQLQVEAKLLGWVPSVKDIRIASKARRTASEASFSRAFGSYSSALRAAGLLA